ncbi:MAG: GNAT family N-acetyltransferase [Chloroflexi bacterium]|nr:GNAT family N-acetyltransferase [Chloroflexota bacterium]MBL7200914.1 GNAT family N-acetyltransferase [Anaerolineae bacterium]
MITLRTHGVTLKGCTPRGVRVRLRPMTEDDWGLLYRWNSDPEVLYYSEGDDVASYTPEQVRDIYCSVCQNALCSIIEADGVPVGDCWLQEMNLERVLIRYPDLDCRRIDLLIGEKQYWGQGVGTEVIRLLTDYAFLEQGVDLIYEPGIADYNVRSRKAFQRVGYQVVKIGEASGEKAVHEYDLILTRKMFLEQRAT